MLFQLTDGDWINLDHVMRVERISYREIVVSFVDGSNYSYLNDDARIVLSALRVSQEPNAQPCEAK